MSLVKLTQEMNNKLTIVNLPKAILYFSYETLIGLVYNFRNEQRLYLNNVCLNYSNTTSKHINKVKQLTNLEPIWKTSKELDLIVETVITP